MAVPQSVLDLVSRFESQRAAYLSGSYNETELHLGFLDPLFDALGWYVCNTKSRAIEMRVFTVRHKVSVTHHGIAMVVPCTLQPRTRNSMEVQ